MAEKVSDYVFRRIAEETGVKTVFMLPGGGCMHLVDSLGKTPGLDYCCVLHEQAAAIGADAAGQLTNDLGVALVTAGPGSTNAITGVAGSWIDSTPVLILSGQAKREDMMTGLGIRQMGIQEVDTARIVAPVTKYAACVTDPERVRYEVEKALYLARHGRKGPVWLDFPLDVQGAMIEPEKQPGYRPDPAPAVDGNAAARRVLEELRRAKHPVVYVGNGVRLAGAVPDFLRLVERLRLPVMTSWKAADFLPDDHPCFAGRPGIIAQRAANLVQQSCDLLWILGTRLDLCQTGFNHPHFAPNARRIITDIDPNEIGKLKMEFAFQAAIDAGELLRAMNALDPAPLDTEEYLRKIMALRRRYPVISESYRDLAKPRVNLYHLVEVLADLARPGDILVPGSSGACAEVTMQAIPVKAGIRIFNTPGLGSMGFGLPAAIAAGILTGKRVISLIGDGGLQHNIQELQTLARTRPEVKLFILNNNGYGSIYQMQKNRFAGHFVASSPESGVTMPQLEKIAAAYGIAYRRIAAPSELADGAAAVLSASGPVLCEVMLDPDVPSAPRLSSETRPDGSIVSKPMEDLAPFLPEEELRAVMEELS